MNSIESVLHTLIQYEKNTPYSAISFDDRLLIKNLENVEFNKDKNGKDLIIICGKKFGLNTKLEYMIQPLEKYYKEYGERSRKAKENEGIDWKALSHAVRVCMQGISLLTYHKINLPMFVADVEILKDIKEGKLSFEEVANIIDDYQDMLQQAVKTSILPDEPNLKAFQNVQIDIYERLIKGYYYDRN